MSRQGTLKVGDRILKINAVDVREATHAEALALLRACSKQLTLEIEFDVTVHGMEMEMYEVTWEWGYSWQSGSGNGVDSMGVELWSRWPLGWPALYIEPAHANWSLSRKKLC